MKLLMISVLASFLSGCTAHAHAPPPPTTVTVGVHSDAIRAWVWVGGHWKNGRWVRAHWELSFVDPILVHQYPALYVRWRLGNHGPPPRPHKKWVKKHRHRRK